MKASEFLTNLTILTREDLLSIKGVGEVLADNYADFLESDRYQLLVNGFANLESAGKTVEIKTSYKAQTQNLPLSNDTIVITGSFDISRTMIKEMLESHGAKVADSISTSTTLLIAGEKAGSKLEKATKLGIKVAFDYRDIVPQ